MIFLALQIAQPYLITKAVHFVDSGEDEIPTSTGYGLIGAFAFVFAFTAVYVPRDSIGSEQLTDDHSSQELGLNTWATVQWLFSVEA
jgi:hypothetical protein